MGRDENSYTLIFTSEKQKYFCAAGLTFISDNQKCFARRVDLLNRLNKLALSCSLARQKTFCAEPPLRRGHRTVRQRSRDTIDSIFTETLFAKILVAHYSCVRFIPRLPPFITAN